ncbi:hypothetical protein AX16_004083 [Volvariella volvacea WC 439]|nr:hypothetical protein AX16_004083 [Volvariella volvacea WC 439]
MSLISTDNSLSKFHHTTLAPIAVLPVETLQEIFLRCYPPAVYHRHRWRLGLVSRKWRHAALACAEYWSHVFVRWSNWPTGPDFILMLDTWTKRSKQRPFYITLTDIFLGSREIDVLLPLLFQHCHRWRSLELHITREITLKAFQALRGTLPQLQSLLIGIQFRSPNSQAYTIDIFSRCSPNLSSLNLFTTYFAPIDVPMQQIMSLTIWNMNALNAFALPNLRHLNILGISHFDTDAVTQFLQRSRCSLKFLKLQFDVVSSWDALRDALRDVLRLSDNLEWLCVQIPCAEQGSIEERFIHDFLRNLWYPGIGQLLPKLRILEFHVDDDTSQIVDAHILYVVENRSKGLGGLALMEQFSFSTGSGIRRKTYKRLKSLVEEGLIVSLDSADHPVEPMLRRPLRDFTGFRKACDDDGGWEEWME